MLINLRFPRSIFLFLIPLFVLMAPCSVFAANCSKKPDHPDCVDPPPDDGGNDTADPDWAILAVGENSSPVFESDCFAFNPDLKGPGIAYGGFYENDGYMTCAQANTEPNGAVIDIRTLDVRVDDSGLFSTIQLRGRNPANGVVYESAVTEFADTGCEAPTTEIGFTVNVEQSIAMYSCETSRKKRRTVCDTYVGDISLGGLVYCPVGDTCESVPDACQ